MQDVECRVNTQRRSQEIDDRRKRHIHLCIHPGAPPSGSAQCVTSIVKFSLVIAWLGGGGGAKHYDCPIGNKPKIPISLNKKEQPYYPCVMCDLLR